MRTKTVNVFETLSNSVGEVVTVADLETAAVGTEGRSISAEVWVLVNELGLNIETIKDGKKNAGFKLVEVADPLPNRILKAIGAFVAPVKAVKQKVTKPEKVIEVATVEVAEAPAVELTKEQIAKAKKANRDKIRRAAQKAAKEAAKIETETAEAIGEFVTTETEDFPEFLKREVEFAE